MCLTSQVLKKTFGHANLKGPRGETRSGQQNTVSPVTNATTGSKKTSALEAASGPSYRPAPDRYDFLDFGATESSYPPPGSISDLPSREASALIASGVVLLPDASGPSGPLDELLVTSNASITGTKDDERFKEVPEEGTSAAQGKTAQ